MNLSGALLCESQIGVVGPDGERFGELQVNVGVVQSWRVLGYPVRQVLDAPSGSCKIGHLSIILY